MTSPLESKPSLPFDQIFGTGSDDGYADIAPVQPAPFREPGQQGHRRDRRPPVTLVEGVPTYAYPNGVVPGPKPPKSWTPLFDGDDKNAPAWRANAMGMLFDDLGAPEWMAEESRVVLPLPLLCAQVLLETGDPQDLVDIADYIPPHVRRDLVRWCAVHQPLSNARLYTLCGDEGHTDGELVVVGPHSSLRGEVLKKEKGKGRAATTEPSDEVGESAAGSSRHDDDDWDTSTDAPPSLTTLVLLASPLPSSLLFSLPPTLTHLALLALPQGAPIHRLPRICPLLEVLDLSFNKWLSGKDEYGASPSEGTISRVEWGRWGHLRVLGLRQCGVRNSIVKKVNASRWTDVEVIGVDGDNFNVPSSSRQNEAV